MWKVRLVREFLFEVRINFPCSRSRGQWGLDPTDQLLHPPPPKKKYCAAGAKMFVFLVHFDVAWGLGLPEPAGVSTHVELGRSSQNARSFV